MKLSFIIAGVQKAGTTALWHFLRQHPALYLPEKKELHFFDNEDLNWEDPDYDGDYHRDFSAACSSRKCGEVTPIYIYWPPALARIQAYNPNVKIIVSLRCPIDRAYSHWAMETRRGSETLSFSDAIREGRNRMNNPDLYPGFHRVFSYVERGFYLRQLDNMYSLFPRKNILLVLQRDLQNRHERTLDRIYDFLQVDSVPTYPRQETVFPRGTTREILAPLQPLDRSFLKNIYADDLDNLSVKYGITF